MPKKQSRYRPTSLLVGVSLCVATLLSAPVPAAAAACQAGQSGCVLPVGTPEPPFYAASFRVDPLGTARMTLALRDELVVAGWEGLHTPLSSCRTSTPAR